MQLAVGGMEKARSVRGSALLSGRAVCSGSCPSVISSQVSDLLGAGIVRWDATGTGTLTVPTPGTQSDGSVVSLPGDPEVVTLDGIAFRRYYYLGACYELAVTTIATDATCGALTATAPLVRLVVAVTWQSTGCPGGTCTYSEAALFSTAVTDPFLGS